MSRFVLHVDLDQFIAAVEVLRRPELRGKPVVVGGSGDPTQRGVVSTASYEARRFGVESGMPLRTAARKCPEAVFLAVDASAYRAASDRVMAVLRGFPAVVEVAGWDEAFLEVEGTDPEAVARKIQRAVLEATGLHSSVGVGDNKLRAKIASGFAKPGGVFRLTGDNWAPVMERRPTDALWGVGPKTARRLASMGILTVGELAASDPDELARTFGPTTGPWLVALGRGQDGSPVAAERGPARSRGREVTFQKDLEDPGRIQAEVRRLARRVADDLAQDGRPAVRVVVKVRFAPFFTHTHGAGLPAPSRDAGHLERAALAALGRFDLDRPVR
ncbi:MAG TPA: DNA polymerase IV, partial [Actinomycetota bacterium]|nr:DNA polymerase IV [Actinomycetota bacterium]